MNAKVAKHQYLLGHWAPIVHACKNSDLTIKAWCEENDINEKQFYYWQRRIREEMLPSMTSATDETPTFVELPQSGSSPSHLFRPDMVLNIGNLRLELSNSVAPELLMEVVKVIRHV